jgi:iron complex outermembrane receptor protein
VPFSLPNPASPSGSTNALILTGGNADLTMEHATTWTTGLDFVPQNWAHGLAFSITYFNINFNDRIQMPTFESNILEDPADAEFVTLNPSAALIEAACNRGNYLPGGTATCAQYPAGAVIDLRLHNMESLRTEGIDFTTAYERAGAFGTLKVGVEGTYLTNFTLQASPDAPPSQLLNTENNPIDLKMRGTISWQGRRFGATAGINFQNHYRDTASEPNRGISSFTTVDAQVRYDIPAFASSWLENTRVELSAINVFNVSPPFLNNPTEDIGYDEENADPLGRLVSLQIRKSW